MRISPMFRRGQAMIELAIGLFAFVLVIGALCSFAHYIVHSLEVQNSTRGASPVAAHKIKIDAWPVSVELPVEEKAQLPEGKIF